MMRRGVITVYLSLVFMLLVSLILVLLESARVYMIGTMSERYADMAAEMVFAGYVRPLAEQYDLLAIDTGKDQQNLENFQKYLELNLENGGDSQRAMNMYGQVEMKEVKEVLSMKDNHWESLKKQVVMYEKLMTVSKGLNSIQNLIGGLQETGVNEKTQDYLGKLESKGEALEKAESEKKNTETDVEETEQELPEMTDPRKGIAGWLKSGVLNLVMGNKAVSGRTIDTSSCSWHTSSTSSSKLMDNFERYRDVTGYVKNQEILTLIKNGIQDQGDQLMLDLYIGDKFLSMRGSSVSGDNKNRTALKYEYEYILFGKESDRENLENAVTAICTLRTFLNLIYLYTSPDKGEVLQAAVEAMSLMSALPVAGEVLKLLLMACWSAAEAVVDCAGLAEGGKVPLMKDQSSWNLSMNQLLNVAKGGARASDYFNDTGKGLDYDQYLMIFMLLTSSEKKLIRMSQLIECNIRLVDGYKDFALSRCAVQAEFSGSVKIGSHFFGHPIEIKHPFDVVYGY